jgi:hypothetical protein
MLATSVIDNWLATVNSVFFTVLDSTTWIFVHDYYVHRASWTCNFQWCRSYSSLRPSSVLLRRKLFSTNRALCALAEYIWYSTVRDYIPGTLHTKNQEISRLHQEIDEFLGIISCKF